jgi:glutamyl-tRNA synthetase
MIEQKIRTRFCPSPTGLLHIGGVRTALFAWAYTRKNGGEFILRIEDTDRARFVEGAENQIVETLKWMGMDWDEGVDVGGPHAPYRQSERLDSYLPYALKLIEEGKAYADPTSTEQLDIYRQAAKDEKRPFHYREHRPENPPAWQEGLPIRLKIDAETSPDWTDLVRGQQKGVSEDIDDFILIKADGYPTYNFAHIIDDHEMQVNLVVRGEEFVSSMPKFLLLYQSLGFDIPQFAHLPNILGETGNKKLSKRDGDVDTLSYRRKGYLPEALMNFLALLGWNDGSEQEIYSKDEFVEVFDFSRVQKSPARYSLDRLRWINGHYIRNLDVNDLYARVTDFWPSSADSCDEKTKKHILSLVQERLKFFEELPELTELFFKRPSITLAEVITADKQLKKKLDQPTAKTYLDKSIAALSQSDFSVEDLEAKLRQLVEELGTNAGVLFKLIRISATGSTTAPPLFDTLATLGKEETLARLQNVLATSAQ